MFRYMFMFQGHAGMKTSNYCFYSSARYDKNGYQVLCASIRTLKLALVEKSWLKCIDNAIITL